MAMTTTTIRVQTATAGYDVVIGAGLLATAGERIARLLPGAPRLFVVTSPAIWQLHGQALQSGFPAPLTVLEVPAGEQHKRLTTLESLADRLAQHGADRDSVLLAFGGGVLGDLTGFLAAVYMRGIRYIGVPTTALAQIDSSIGGKTGVNLAAGKNLLGAFHHPLAVFADTATLATLPAAELRAGLQEAVKAGIIRDPALFDELDGNSAQVLAGDQAALTRVIAASVRVKAEVVSLDERESGLRMLLNLGHTLGHAIEAATHYNTLLHGEAVAWGMLAAVRIAQHRGLVTAGEAARIGRVVRCYGPLQPFTAGPAELVALTAKDKKNRSGTRSFVLPTGIGEAVVVRDVTEAELLDAATAIVAEAAAVEVPA
jgi:3-dehydroquinate synthase